MHLPWRIDILYSPFSVDAFLPLDLNIYSGIFYWNNHRRQRDSLFGLIIFTFLPMVLLQFPESVATVRPNFSKLVTFKLFELFTVSHSSVVLHKQLSTPIAGASPARTYSTLSTGSHPTINTQTQISAMFLSRRHPRLRLLSTTCLFESRHTY